MLATPVSAPFAACPHCAANERQALRRPARVVELPLGGAEDRLLGTLHLERAIRSGERHFEPGVLAAANRGVLYIDEVNLLPDHLVDLLLDAAAMGRNVVEREGISFAHPARFALIGTMNPEEGDLRPQFLDRFGLAVDIAGITDPRDRAEVVRRRIAHDADPAAFAAHSAAEEAAVRDQLAVARNLLPAVTLADNLLDLIAHLCISVGVDGLRADLTIYKAACAHAAWEGRTAVTAVDVRLAAELALPHRRRRQPFQSRRPRRPRPGSTRPIDAGASAATRAPAPPDQPSPAPDPTAEADAPAADPDDTTISPTEAARISLPPPLARQRSPEATPAHHGPAAQPSPRAGRPGAVRPATSATATANRSPSSPPCKRRRRSNSRAAPPIHQPRSDPSRSTFVPTICACAAVNRRKAAVSSSWSMPAARWPRSSGWP